MKSKILISIFCSLLIALWAYASLDKLTAFSTFGSQLRLQPIPAWAIPVVQWGLPFAELVIALLIYIQTTRKTGLILSTILMSMFTLYVLFALTGAYGEIPCSCAGIISALHWKGHLIFNIIFLLISAAGLYLENNKSGNPDRHRPIHIKTF